eukprot:TRINITY_DN8183_c0_g1_i18.p1 TRINITY_DN8183_c0_g1~~TRINITY_DN8183_c0_g1_i18.p1  ORF type:complete len:231 (-),score=7.60 TRINITY_DN8183_c0_g1_i18:12-704(-)
MSKCKRCGKTAYDAESVSYDDKKYHTTCFKCLTCKSALSPSAIAQLNGNLYCKNCYTKSFKEGGGSYDVFKAATEEPEDDTKYRTVPRGDVSIGRCAECKLTVPINHLVYQDNQYHAECYFCYNCKKKFADSSSDTSLTIKEGKLFCNEKCASSRTCPTCAKVIIGPVWEAMDKKWHVDCFSCGDCGKKLGGMMYLERDERPDVPLCTKCEIGRAVQQECRDRSRMPSSA